MEVQVAKSAGFCFGVKRAVQMVYDEAEKNPGRVYTMGPIIHNEQVVEDLARKGVRIIGDDLIVVDEKPLEVEDEALKAAADLGKDSSFCIEKGQMPPSGSVIIVRSHGISRQMTEKLSESGYQIVTATCPFVQKIHDIVAEKSREGYGIIIIGNPNHPEVEGIRGWVDGPCAVVESEEDVRRLAEAYEETKKCAANASREHLPIDMPVWVVSQTTFHHDNFHKIVAIIRRMCYDAKVTNTICNATRERQMESMELAAKSDVMIVIGGKNSSNTQKLYDICRSQCGNTYYIQKLEDLFTVRFQSDCCVGITAGASTPNTIIQEVCNHVRRAEL